MDAFEPEDYGKMVKDMLNKAYDMEVTQLFFRVFAKGPDAIQAVKFLKAMPPVKNLYNFLKSTIGEFKADALSEDDFNKAVKDKFFSTGGQTHELLSVKGGRQQRSSRRNSQRQQSSSRRNKRNSRSSRSNQQSRRR
jgi:hypothetical protein